MKDTKIAWCDHTFNPWIGCAKVSPGCDNCYAEAMDKRFGGGHYGRGAPRKRTSAANWRQPVKWMLDYEKQCHDECTASDSTVTHAPRPKVFSGSLCDWLDDEAPVGWLADLLALIHDTPNLDWLLLSKRPENFLPRIKRVEQFAFDERIRDMAVKFAEWRDGTPPPNVWIGTTVENQEMADKRIPELLKIPAKVRFLSVEPMLGPVDLWGAKYKTAGKAGMTGAVTSWEGHGVDWVICGGESGANARPMHPDWARGLRDQCAAAGVPFFFKQWGEWRDIEDIKEYGVDLLTCKYKGESEISINGRSPATVTEVDGCCFIRMGRERAGRLLDGAEHSAFPEARQ